MILRKDKTITQIHLDTTGTQRIQHYLSIFGKLKTGIMNANFKIVNSKICTIIFKYIKKMFIMSSR